MLGIVQNNLIDYVDAAGNIVLNAPVHTFQVKSESDLTIIKAAKYEAGTRAYLADESKAWELGADGNWHLKVGLPDDTNATMFSVTFTTASDTTTADKTQEEIAAAVEAGKTVFCQYNGAFALYDGEHDSATFNVVDGTGPTLDNIVIAWDDDDSEWNLTKTSYTLTPAE